MASWCMRFRFRLRLVADRQACRTSIGESAAVRAVVSRAAPGLVFVVRFRVLGAAVSADSGCVASASRARQRLDTAVRVALAPRRVWCAGAGALRVAAARRGARAGEARLRVRPPEAFGRGTSSGTCCSARPVLSSASTIHAIPSRGPTRSRSWHSMRAEPRRHGRSRSPMAASRSICLREATPCTPIERPCCTRRSPTRVSS